MRKLFLAWGEKKAESLCPNQSEDLREMKNEYKILVKKLKARDRLRNQSVDRKPTPWDGEANSRSANQPRR